MRKSIISMILSFLLIVVLVSGTVNATITISSVASSPEPVEYGDDVTFTGVITSDITSTPTVTLDVDGTDYSSSVSFDGIDTYTLTLSSTLFDLDTLLFTFDATDADENLSLITSFTVQDTTDPVINDYSIPTAVCYGDSIAVFADATDNYDDPVSYVAVNIDGTDYPLSEFSDTSFTHAVAIDSTTFSIGSYVADIYAEDSEGNSALSDAESLDIYDCSTPTIDTVTESEDPVEYGNTITITADVTDDISAIESVVLTVDDGTTTTDYDMDNGGSGDTYSVTLDTVLDLGAIGTYTYTITATDDSTDANSATTTADTFDVIDTTVPEISLLGNNPETAEVGSTYTDAGATAEDNYDGDITSSITTTSDVDTSVVGSYTVTYTVTDSSGNTATTMRAVYVFDTTAPEITILGNDPETVEVGDTYTDAGATAEDNYDGDITSSIVTTSDVDESVVGSYTVIYDVTDSNGNSAAATRVVDVVDTTVPEITLLGNNPETVEVGDTYTDAGATAEDNYDGDITSSITTLSDVDTTVVGSYSVVYVTEDSAGNSAAATRVVEVVDTTIPVITLDGDNPQTIEVGDSYTELGATAEDNYDGDITTSIVIDASAVDTSVVDSYTVTYDVTDSEGNVADTVTRTVDVVDTTIPVITLDGDNPQTIEVGDSYTELGATAEDNYDGDITTSIVIDASAVDTDTLSSYSVTYDVTDSEGNDADTVTRTVDVVDTTAPSIDSYEVSPTVTPEFGDAVTIIATVTDNDVVSSVEVDVEGTTYTMTNTGGDTYESSSIDTTSLGLGVQSYTITATDNSGSTNTEADIFVVIDSVDPMINSVADTPDPVEFGADVTFTADVTDDNGVDSVEVEIDGTAYAMSYDSSSGLYVYVLDSSVLSVTTYTYTITAIDDFGNDATDSSGSLTVADSEVPVLTVLGNNPETVEVGETYTDAGATAEDNVDGDLTSSIITTSDVDTTIVNSYTVTYVVEDNAGNSATATRVVEVVDTTVPVITILGNDPETVEAGEIYTDAGATAEDSYDGDLTDSIVTTSDVDESIVGSYTVIYDVTDSEGNEAETQTRVVDVVDTTGPTISDLSESEDPVEYGDSITITVDVVDEISTIESVVLRLDGGLEYDFDNGGSGDTYSVTLETTGMESDSLQIYEIIATDSEGNENLASNDFTVEDTTAPEITVLGNDPETVEAGDTYTDAGATAEDSYAGDLTASIITTSDVDTTIVDSYTVTYTVTDTSANTATATRTVNVVDSEAPEITLLGNNQETVEAGDTYTDAGAEATDNYDGDITASITTVSDVDESVVGSYTVTYDVTDSEGNEAETQTRVVDVVDTTGPTISALSESEDPVEYGDSITISVDVVDEISTIESVVLRFALGLGLEYELDNGGSGDTYSVTLETTGMESDSLQVYEIVATDSEGNENLVSDDFTVEDTTAPTISVLGNDPETVEAGDTYTDAGATAEDSYAGDLTDSIITTSDVDESVVGSYTVTYTVTDTSANTATATRTVDVVDTTAPSIDSYEVSPTDTPEFGDAVTIIATVTDNDVVSSVEVDVEGTTYTMTNTGGDTYESSSIDTTALGLGVQSYTITASDGTNTDTESDIFLVIDSVDPVINSVADTPDPVEFGADVTFTADVTDDNGVDSVALEIDSASYTMEYDSSTGLYTSVLDSDLLSVDTFTYTVTATDVFGNTDITDGSDTLTVADNEIPVITLLGTDETVEVGSTYTDAGATAEDNVDGDITASIVTVNPVDTSVVGTYTVTYDVTDSSGNEATSVTRTVTVVDTTAPEITILGNNPETIEAGTTYTDAGATATDAGDGDLTSSISTTSTVDTTVVGSYTVTYTVTDSAGLSDTEVRTVDVVDTTAPVINSVSLSATQVNEGDTITFTVDVTDNQGITSVVLTTNGVDYSMSNGGSGDVYTADIDTTGFALDSYSYTIKATDNSGNTDSETGTYDVTIVSPMTVRILADKTSGEEDLDVSFASSVDAGGAEPFAYSWSFGDGDTDSSKNVRHVFTADGTYTVTLTVRDQYGNEGTASVVITVSEEASSNDPKNNIQITSLSIPNDVVVAGDVLEVSVDVENIGNSRLNDVSMTVFIPELGLWQRTTAEDIRTGNDESFTVGLDIPADVEPGVYDVRVTVSNDDYSRVKHRDIVIE